MSEKTWKSFKLIFIAVWVLVALCTNFLPDDPEMTFFWWCIMAGVTMIITTAAFLRGKEENLGMVISERDLDAGRVYWLSNSEEWQKKSATHRFVILKKTEPLPGEIPLLRGLIAVSVPSGTFETFEVIGNKLVPKKFNAKMVNNELHVPYISN